MRAAPGPTGTSSRSGGRLWRPGHRRRPSAGPRSVRPPRSLPRWAGPGRAPTATARPPTSATTPIPALSARTRWAGSGPMSWPPSPEPHPSPLSPHLSRRTTCPTHPSSSRRSCWTPTRPSEATASSSKPPPPRSKTRSRPLSRAGTRTRSSHPRSGTTSSGRPCGRSAPSPNWPSSWPRKLAQAAQAPLRQTSSPIRAPAYCPRAP